MRAQRRLRDELAVAAGGDTLARPLQGARDSAGSAGANFRTRDR